MAGLAGGQAAPGRAGLQADGRVMVRQSNRHHSIPVQVNRNGLRAIASGTGNPERLELRHVADTADIKEGDLLVSSGLGQRFPAGPEEFLCDRSTGYRSWFTGNELQSSHNNA